VNNSFSQFQISRFDWRWVVVGYCSLILLQLFPSYFLFGLRRAPMTNMSGMFVFWMGIGVAIVSGFIGSRSKGYPVMESFSVALLYLLTAASIYRGGFKSLLADTPLNTKYMFLLLFFGLCLIGTITGKLRRMRREKKQQLA
jgi:formate-dependent nitrite reductase membrane component NrfD